MRWCGRLRHRPHHLFYDRWHHLVPYRCVIIARFYLLCAAIALYLERIRHRTLTLRGANSNGSVVIATLELSAGKVSRNDLNEVRDWASEPADMALLLEVRRRLHERD